MSRARVQLREVLRSAADVGALRATRHGATPLVLLTAVDFVQKFDNAVFGLLLPEIRDDLGVTIGTLTAALSVVGVVVIATKPAVGYLADRTRRTALVGISAILSGVFSLLTGATRGLGQLVAVRTVDEAGEGVGDIPTASLLADYYPVESRGKAYAARRVALDLAQILAPPAVGLVALRAGWRAPFVVLGPLLVVTGIVVLVRLREPVRGFWERHHLGASDEVAAGEDPPMTFGEATRALLANRTLRRVVLALALTSIGSAWFSVLFNFFLNEEFGYDVLQRGLLFVPGSVAAIAGAFLGGGLVEVLVERRPQRMLVLLGLVAMAGTASTFVVIAVPSLVTLIPSTIIFGFVSGLIGPATATVMSLVIPARLRGQGMGIFSLVALPSSALVFVAGDLAQSLGIRGALFATLPMLAAGAAVFVSAAGFFESDMRTATAAAMAAEEHRRAKREGRTTLLVCRGLDVAYGSVGVLFGVDFDVTEGEIVALLGTNGAGKSTLLRAISGIRPARGGTILFDGVDITQKPPYEITRAGIAHMPGGRGVFADLTVAENLRLALWSVPDDERDERWSEVLDQLPVVAGLLDTPAGSLSGGEQQLVALAQAFLARPRLLLVDELSLGLAPAVVADLLGLLRRLHAGGTTIVVVEQSVNLALSIAQRAVFLEKGEVRFEGPAADLLARPDLMRAVYVKGSAALAGDGAAARRPGPATSGRRPVLEVDGLVKRYGGVTAVDGVGFGLADGQALGLIGPNGAGKTTILELISGHQVPDAGSVRLDGVDVTRMAPDARARARLIRRFQDARLFPSLTVRETIELALERDLEVRSTFLTALGAPAARRAERKARGRAEQLVDMLELGGARDTPIGELSTGQRRIVDLACVLAAEPKVLLLDEPSTGIAQAEAEQLGPLLRRIRVETGAALVVIEHDVPLLTSVVDELLALVAGREVVRGEAAEVLSHPVVVEAYLGSDTSAIERQGARTR